MYAPHLRIRSGWTEFSPYIRTAHPFRTARIVTREGTVYPNGTFRAVSAPEGTEIGILPHQFREDFRAATYTVYSFGTPIAWLPDAGDWVVPNVRYGSSTSRHQKIVRTCLEDIGYVGEPVPVIMRIGRAATEMAGMPPEIDGLEEIANGYIQRCRIRLPNGYGVLLYADTDLRRRGLAGFTVIHRVGEKWEPAPDNPVVGPISAASPRDIAGYLWELAAL